MRKQKYRLKSPALRVDKTYIIPTQFGFLFGVVALFMLILAMGFSNNVIYLLVFLFISVSILSLGITNRYVDQVKLELDTDHLFFENEENLIPLNISSKDNISKVNRFDSQQIYFDIDDSIFTDIQGQPSQLVWRPIKYGRQFLPRIRIFSEYPFGISYAWKFFQYSSPVAVYPEKKGKSFFNTEPDSEGHKEQTGGEALDSDYFLHEKFLGTQNLKSIDWKKYYKLQQLFVRQKYSAEDQRIILIQWEDTAFINNFSDRLRQMAFWISECEELNCLYQVKVPAGGSGVSRGRRHYRQCLDLLLEIFES